MGRNVKTIYFNDLLALPNDYKRVKKSGELRDIKRTKSDYNKVIRLLEDRNSFESKVSKGINNLIALVDSDPSLSVRGSEAEYIQLKGGVPAALIANNCGEESSLAVVNLSAEKTAVYITEEKIPFNSSGMLFDNIAGKEISFAGSSLELELEPFGRLWLTKAAVDVPEEKLVK